MERSLFWCNQRASVFLVSIPHLSVNVFEVGVTKGSLCLQGRLTLVFGLCTVRESICLVDGTLMKHTQIQMYPKSVATLPPFGPIEGQKWFDQIPSH